VKTTLAVVGDHPISIVLNDLPNLWTHVVDVQKDLERAEATHVAKLVHAPLEDALTLPPRLS
jgi:hypothetical protein